MTAALLRAQSTRFAGLDPLLPAAVEPPPGDLLTAALPDGERVSAVLTRTLIEPGTPQSLWSASEVFELHPLLGAADGGALDPLLRALPGRLTAAGTDTACVVTWPSRDAAAARALMTHGFIPLSVLAVRTTPPPPSDPVPGVVVRRATRADLDVLVESALAEVAYSAQVGGAIPRSDARAVKRAALRAHLTQGDPIWLAERDGVAVGHAEGWHTESRPGSWAETRVRHGRWGYVNCLSVLPHARHAGVGRALMDVAHADLSPRTVGSFLYYNPPNPLSPAFWARQGYRPLWTVWEVRPAAALR
ncbi:GNAT family N-acetyltransferase [Actinokineospora xionganensis]|uniref:GNAT family N-acetyltransferase n=1 Tax=Actinokineospora xionganensis TaxID=2684470 RepID=A0ABR7LE62_9PSEU|nr:GNAT family N-acetyltransferase [Actinokineospora xionganensis]MBC6450954.1 GNAT family N-acetyltransferase [Actinokineospora xionganensis]